MLANRTPIITIPRGTPDSGDQHTSKWHVEIYDNEAHALNTRLLIRTNMETEKKSEGNNIVEKEGMGLLKENHKGRCNKRRKIYKFI